MEMIIYEGIIFKKPDNDNRKKYRSKTKQAECKGLIKRMPCEICGNTIVNAHHEIYAEYMNVRWLCYCHHFKIHAIFRKLSPRSLF